MDGLGWLVPNMFGHHVRPRTCLGWLQFRLILDEAGIRLQTQTHHGNDEENQTKPVLRKKIVSRKPKSST